MIKILICSTQRSGTTMICEDFRNTGVLGNPNEYFNHWGSNKEAIDSIDWEKNLENIITQAKTENDVLSIKVMANQMHSVNQKLLTFSKKTDYKEKFLSEFYETFKDAFYIRVYRRDKLRQAISALIARKTEIFHAVDKSVDNYFAGKLLKGYKEDYNTEFDTDITEIDTQIKHIYSQESIWDKFFDQNNIKYYPLYYEDICNSDYQYLHKISKEIGISIPDKTPQRKSLKLSNSINEEWVQRYQEEKQKFPKG